MIYEVDVAGNRWEAHGSRLPHYGENVQMWVGGREGKIFRCIGRRHMANSLDLVYLQAVDQVELLNVRIDGAPSAKANSMAREGLHRDG